MTNKQLTLTFETPRFDNLKEVINHVVYSCGKQVKFIAAELDMSPPQLSMILAGTDDRKFPAEKLPDLIRVTAPKGYTIIYWLIDKFLTNEAERRTRALIEVEAILPNLMRAVEELKK